MKCAGRASKKILSEATDQLSKGRPDDECHCCGGGACVAAPRGQRKEMGERGKRKGSERLTSKEVADPRLNDAGVVVAGTEEECTVLLLECRCQLV